MPNYFFYKKKQFYCISLSKLTPCGLVNIQSFSSDAAQLAPFYSLDKASMLFWNLQGYHLEGVKQRDVG